MHDIVTVEQVKVIIENDYEHARVRLVDDSHVGSIYWGTWSCHTGPYTARCYGQSLGPFDNVGEAVHAVLGVYNSR